MSVADGLGPVRGGAVTDGVGPRLGRRRVLSGAAASALGALPGCSTQFFEESPPTIDGADLRSATDGDAPAVPETVPVDIETSFVETLRASARSKLDSTPAPFDETEIPNGVIRERLNSEYDSALRLLRDASGAPTPYERLGHAARARTSAHEVQAAWAGIDRELTVTDRREAVPAVNRDIDTLASTHTYVGDDPVRAAVVHRQIERRISGARRWLSIQDREFDIAAETSLDLAEVATDIERARVDVAVGAYLFDRFRESLDTAADQRGRLTDAREALKGQVSDRGDSVPAGDVDDATSLVDRDIETTAGVHALEELAWEVQSRLKQVERADDESAPASNVVSAFSILTYIDAFNHLRDRIEGGDDIAVETAKDVADFRATAITAIEAAGDVDRGQVLVDALRPQFARELEQVDRRLDDDRSEIRVVSVSRDAGGYVRIAALCSVLPAIAETVVRVLRGSA